MYLKSDCGYTVFTSFVVFLFMVFYVEYSYLYAGVYMLILFMLSFARYIGEKRPEHPQWFVFTHAIAPFLQVQAFMLAIMAIASFIVLDIGFQWFCLYIIISMFVLVLVFSRKAKKHWEINLNTSHKKSRKRFDLVGGVLNTDRIKEDYDRSTGGTIVLYAVVSALIGRILSAAIDSDFFKVLIVLTVGGGLNFFMFQNMYVRMIYPLVKITIWERKEKRKMVVRRG